jgi:hypothetical protein
MTSQAEMQWTDEQSTTFKLVQHRPIYRYVVWGPVKKPDQLAAIASALRETGEG